MEEFVIFNRDELTKNVYIVSAKYPYYIGRIICFEDNLKYAAYTNQYKGLAYAQVYPYRIIVEINKTLAGVIEIGPMVLAHINYVAKRMAQYYFDEVIKPNGAKFVDYRF